MALAPGPRARCSFYLFVSRCSSLVVRLKRRTGRRPASGRNLAPRLGFRGRGVHRFALDPPSSTCQINLAGQPRQKQESRRRGGGKQEVIEHEDEQGGGDGKATRGSVAWKGGARTGR